ncbi:hypothetical protein [Micromonospora echinofusca]|uniref:hypothetical protein n=1 Tax=Micromonospora echinofusca TaxID=47858 RepID=UPI001FCAC3A7|nr:hypothetical protein [Micromonospora echinofusca]
MTYPGNREALLLIADADLLHRPQPLRPNKPIALVTVPTPPQPQPPHTVIPSFTGSQLLPVLTRTHNGGSASMPGTSRPAPC